MRLFVAIPVPPEAKTVLAGVVYKLKDLAPTGVRWVDPAGMHLTLKFLGNVAPSRVGDIARAAARAVGEQSSFQVRLAGLGTFPGGSRPRVLWVGVDAEGDHLQTLRDRLEAAMADLGFPLEGRLFSPHLTLGRVREGASGPDLKAIAGAAAAITPKPSTPWLAESVCVVQSHLGPGGATYSILDTLPLGGPPAS